ncbi:MAG TPA: LLM class flavin-dependent oxidoreductase, partial [Dongiaceae bacterium]|nr:LLM class flavin-dependent oxidoreductase [Dongiaceae bacterium]
ATPGQYYQNVPITARMLAEQVGTLAAIASGRFILQAGLGDDEGQFAAMGTTLRTRPSAFEESLDIVRRLLRGEVVSSAGRFHFRGARVALRPAEPVEVWIACSAPVAIDRAARLGDGWLAAPGATPEQARTQITLYRERCAAHGRTPTAIAVRRDIYVAESSADAETVRDRTAGYRGFDPKALVIGTMAEVIARFRDLGAMGATDIIIRHVIDEQPRVLASLARLAEVRKALA